MHKFLIIVSCSVILFLTNCSAYTFPKTIDDSVTSKAKKLKTLYFLASGTPSIAENYKVEFFKEFPNSFSELLQFYGYNNDTAAILYNQVENHIFKLFNSLDVVNDTLYAQKLINISIGGHWEADAVSAIQEGLQSRVLGSPDLFVYLLSKRNDKEIKSFWFFYFDEPHPSGKLNDKLDAIKTIDQHVYQLMLESRKKVLSQSK